MKREYEKLLVIQLEIAINRSSVSDILRCLSHVCYKRSIQATDYRLLALYDELADGLLRVEALAQAGEL